MYAQNLINHTGLSFGAVTFLLLYEHLETKGLRLDPKAALANMIHGLFEELMRGKISLILS